MEVKTQGEAGDKLRLRSWIEVQLIGEDDQPIPSVGSTAQSDAA